MERWEGEEGWKRGGGEVEVRKEDRVRREERDGGEMAVGKRGKGWKGVGRWEGRRGVQERWRGGREERGSGKGGGVEGR